jgi:hypothetical protein
MAILTKKLLARRHLTRDRLFDALGGELRGLRYGGPKR